MKKGERKAKCKRGHVAWVVYSGSRYCRICMRAAQRRFDQKHRNPNRIGKAWRYKNETGKRYGKLLVLRLSHMDFQGCAYFPCKCDCGRKKKIWGFSLRNGDVTQCGCERKNFLNETGKQYGCMYVVREAEKDKGGNVAFLCRCTCGKERVIGGHVLRYAKRTGFKVSITKACSCARFRGMSKLQEYAIWRGIISRCCNPKDKRWDTYGGRGITVAPEWLGPTGFPTFFAYVGQRPSKEHSLDRIHPDKNYEPGNVRWGNGYLQRMNQRAVWEQVNAEEEAAKWAEGAVEPATECTCKPGEPPCRYCDF
jgi:hypothetical protein